MTAKTKNTISNPFLSGIVGKNTELKDELGRKPFAEGISTLIKSHKQKDCFVIGIEGAWGEGKSYTIELIRREFENDNKKNNVKWIEFNPWYFTDKEHLASIFLNHLSKELTPPKTGLRKKIHDIIFPVAKYISKWGKHDWLVSLIVIVLIGILTESEKLFATLGISSLGISYIVLYLASPKFNEDKNKTLSALTNLLNDYAETVEDHEKLTNEKTLEQLKNEISKKLKSNKLPFSKIIVSIEDLDRLDAQEVRSMMQLIRMVADFPNVIYLLGYDRKQVVNALGNITHKPFNEESVIESGEGYLQKIVQASFKLPQPNNHEISGYIFHKWKDISENIYGIDYEKSTYWQQASPLLGELFNNIREGERVINRAMLIATMLRDKSNPIDVLASAYLMEFQDDLWKWIWFYRETLYRGAKKLLKPSNKTGFLANDKTQPQDAHMENFIKGDNDTIENIVNLMKIVFPSLSYDSGVTGFEEKKHYRICTREHLESYFRYKKSAFSKVEDIIPDLLKFSGKKRIDLIEDLYSQGEDSLFAAFTFLSEEAKNKFSWQKGGYVS